VIEVVLCGFDLAKRHSSTPYVLSSKLAIVLVFDIACSVLAVEIGDGIE
jgi:hypothetical protein